MFCGGDTIKNGAAIAPDVVAASVEQFFNYLQQECPPTQEIADIPPETTLVDQSANAPMGELLSDVELRQNPTSWRGMLFREIYKVEYGENGRMFVRVALLDNPLIGKFDSAVQYDLLPEPKPWETIVQTEEGVFRFHTDIFYEYDPVTGELTERFDIVKTIFEKTQGEAKSGAALSERPALAELGRGAPWRSTVAANIAFFALLGMAGFGLESLIAEGDEPTSAETAVSFGIPGAGAVLYQFGSEFTKALEGAETTVLKAGTKAGGLTLAGLVQGLAMGLPIAASVNSTAEMLGLDPEDPATRVATFAAAGVLIALGFAALPAGLTIGMSILASLGIGLAVGGALLGSAALIHYVADPALGGLIDNYREPEFIDDGTATGHLADMALQSEEVRWVHNQVEEHPWTAYAGVSWALTGNPFLGLAVYGIKEGIEWLTEPVDMQVDENVTVGDNAPVLAPEEIQVQYAGTPVPPNLA